MFACLLNKTTKNVKSNYWFKIFDCDSESHDLGCSESHGLWFSNIPLLFLSFAHSSSLIASKKFEQTVHIIWLFKKPQKDLITDSLLGCDKGWYGLVWTMPWRQQLPQNQWDMPDWM